MGTQSYPMSGGDGLNSYAQNSGYQRLVVEYAKPMVKKAIEDELEFTNFSENSTTFAIADFGCSVGSNTLIATQNIIEAVKEKYQSKHPDHPPLDFQVFFSDHVNNDFNTLFRNLPPSREFFAAGVPGSFHNRLFPKASLHVGHSSYAVHWLSKLPEEILDPNSPAYNKDSIHCTGFSKEVAKAFLEQFHIDMESFLNARAQEVVSGGLFLLTVAGLPEGTVCSQTYHGVNHDVLDYCLKDMAEEGIISKEKLEAFNIPIYFPPFEDLEAVLKRSTYFSMEKIDPSLAADMGTPITPDMVPSLASGFRAISEELIRHHFGDEIVDSVFERFLKKISESLHLFDDKHRPINIFVVLKRKN
ncbi:hypothetical protein Tsubulata_033362 [Turnera subulata]|uniref:S-adenosylmethionine-dependent methyltransferase At5g38100 n=1 Tax=Turnera subulata TaxID=218843 RepID=A0A9Q0JH21_9ROSI|nr:hypothetical protein Tsubulata_033362 [Turnera subulata]